MKKNLVRAVFALLTIVYVASHFMPRAHAAQPHAMSVTAVPPAGGDGLR